MNCLGSPFDATRPAVKGQPGDLRDGEGRAHPGAALAHAASRVVEHEHAALVLAGADGTLWTGSGNEGKVFKIDTQGKGTLFFDSAELEVHALAPVILLLGMSLRTLPLGSVEAVCEVEDYQDFLDLNTIGRRAGVSRLSGYGPRSNPTASPCTCSSRCRGCGTTRCELRGRHRRGATGRPTSGRW